MGYSHSFKCTGHHPTQMQWNTFKLVLKRAFDHLPYHSTSSGAQYKDCVLEIFEWDGINRFTDFNDMLTIEVDDDGSSYECLAFNGDLDFGRDLGHDSFLLTFPLPSVGTYYTKTARKPYDWFVIATLLLMENHLSDCFEIESDGEFEDWKPVAEWLGHVTGKNIRIPASVKETVVMPNKRFTPTVISLRDWSIRPYGLKLPECPSVKDMYF